MRTLCNLFLSLSLSQDLFSIFSFCLSVSALLVAVQQCVDQTAVVWQIIFSTRCKAPDLINYNSVRVITAGQLTL